MLLPGENRKRRSAVGPIPKTSTEVDWNAFHQPKGIDIEIKQSISFRYDEYSAQKAKGVD
jgi:hypothetical protein